MSVQAITDQLEALGFVQADGAVATQQAVADAAGLSDNGAYKVLAVLTKGQTVVLVEQNQSPEESGGVSSIVCHPPIAIFSSPKGRTAVTDLGDVQLVETVAASLS